jgi:hypothetical protein
VLITLPAPVEERPPAASGPISLRAAADITASSPVSAPGSPPGAASGSSAAPETPAATRSPAAKTRRPHAPLRNATADGPGLGALGQGGGAEHSFGPLAALALFLAFFVDALRRVTGVRSTPSAELGGPPERPG